jgi:hypothetical protein
VAGPLVSRPGDGGIVFGHIARMSFIVWSTPYPGREDEYNRW